MQDEAESSIKAARPRKECVVFISLASESVYAKERAVEGSSDDLRQESRKSAFCRVLMLSRMARLLIRDDPSCRG